MASRSPAPPCTSSRRSSMRARSCCRPPVPVLDDDTVETLSARILAEEHRIYPEAIGSVLAGGWRVEGRRFVRSARYGDRSRPVKRSPKPASVRLRCTRTGFSARGGTVNVNGNGKRLAGSAAVPRILRRPRTNRAPRAPTAAGSGRPSSRHDGQLVLDGLLAQPETGRDSRLLAPSMRAQESRAAGA